MTLAIFDLDNTLIADDSDYLWGQFLVERGVVDRAYYEASNAHFYELYKQGRLDISEFLAFALKPLADNEPEQLYRWREQFIEEKIRPILLPAARQLLDKHRAQGHTILVITATNHFVTEPIVALYGIEHLIATRPEMRNGRYTGRYEGTPCFQDGKVKRLEEWLGNREASALQGSWFYSDSHNDVSLMLRVDNPVAVDPDDKLRAIANERGWPVISLRDGQCPEHHFVK